MASPQHPIVQELFVCHSFFDAAFVAFMRACVDFPDIHDVDAQHVCNHMVEFRLDDGSLMEARYKVQYFSRDRKTTTCLHMHIPLPTLATQKVSAVKRLHAEDIQRFTKISAFAKDWLHTNAMLTRGSCSLTFLELELWDPDCLHMLTISFEHGYEEPEFEGSPWGEPFEEKVKETTMDLDEDAGIPSSPPVHFYQEIPDHTEVTKSGFLKLGSKLKAEKPNPE